MRVVQGYDIGRVVHSWTTVHLASVAGFYHSVSFALRFFASHGKRIVSTLLCSFMHGGTCRNAGTNDIVLFEQIFVVDGVVFGTVVPVVRPHKHRGAWYRLSQLTILFVSLTPSRK